MKKSPLVSCLMVTTGKAGRLDFIEKSMRCYALQTYRQKELVIVAADLTGQERVDLASRVRRAGRNDLRCVFLDGQYSLGELRNISIEYARGKILCQWDDDDLSHPARISTQLTHLRRQGKGAVLFQEILHFFAPTNELFVVDLQKHFLRCHSGTIMRFRDPSIRYPVRTPVVYRAEEKILMDQLMRKSLLSVIRGLPHLFVYVYHGENRWGYDDHRALSRHALTKRALTRGRRALVRNVGALAKPLEVDLRGIKVMSARGAAFSL